MQNFADPEVRKIAITGGPCGGKTTIIASLFQWLCDHGFVTGVVREAATELIQDGYGPAKPWRDDVAFQQLLARFITTREDLLAGGLCAIASDRPRVLLCDRGVPDAAAYTTPEQFSRVLQAVSSSMLTLRDRYDAVVHLVTAADGAPQYYTTANNSARKESPEEAIALDRRTQEAWIGHQHLRVVDNSTNFEGKVLRARQVVAHALGIPVPLEIERKYLLRGVVRFPLPVYSYPVNIEQWYLPIGDEAEERRVRRRGQDGSYTYFYTEKMERSPGVRSERERQIGEREFERLMGEWTPRLGRIEKTRHCFVWQSQYFELDVFPYRYHEGSPLHLLEIEPTEEHSRIELPLFFDVVREVTNDPAFYNKRLARRSA